MIKVNVKRVFNTTKENLWDIITNNEKYDWNKSLDSVEVKDKLHYTEKTKKGLVTECTIINSDKCNEYKISFENEEMLGNKIFKFIVIDEKSIMLDMTYEVTLKTKKLGFLAKSAIRKEIVEYQTDVDRATGI